MPRFFDVFFSCKKKKKGCRLSSHRRDLVFQPAKRDHVDKVGNNIRNKHQNYTYSQKRLHGEKIAAHHSEIGAVEEYDIQQRRAHPEDRLTAIDGFIYHIQLLRMLKFHGIHQRYSFV